MSNGADRMVKSARDGFICSPDLRGRKITRVFIDVDTQRDFMYPHGAAYFREAARIAPRLAKLFNCARCRGYPVISTTMCLRNNGNGRIPHQDNGCVEGTNGQKKPAFALLGRRTRFGANGNTDLPPGLLRRYQQVIFERRSPNPFEHPKFDRLLTGMMVSEYVVFGLATEQAVKDTVLGLLARGKPVKLVIDATAGRDSHQAQMALRLMLAKGARVITTRGLAPEMQPRANLDVFVERLTAAHAAQGLTNGRCVSPTAAVNSGGNGHKARKEGGNGNGHNGKGAKAGGGNGKCAKAHGGNGRNGNGKHIKAHAGNGNGKSKDNGKVHSKPAPAHHLSSSLKGG